MTVSRDGKELYLPNPDKMVINKMVKKNLGIKFFLLITFLFDAASAGASRAETEAMIIVIKSDDIAPYSTALKGFQDTLKEEGIDFSIFQYCLPYLKESSKKSGQIIEEIKSRKPDLILTFGSLATRVASKVKDTPLVFSMVLDPEGNGFVKSMKSSDNNLTGVSMDIPVQEQFKKIKSILPWVVRIGVLYDQNESEKIIKEMIPVALNMGLRVIAAPIKSEQDLPGKLKDLSGKIDLLWAIPDPTVFSSQSTRFILLFTLRERLPFMGLSVSFVKAGALFAFYNDYYEIGRQTGETVFKILRGKKPFEIPVVFPRKNLLAINLRVAEVIGIIIPKKILNQADKIFE